MIWEDERDGTRNMNKRKTGAAYEQMAADYLKQKGYEILEYNFRNRQGEIDLIAKDGTCLVFVEVKYRIDRRSGDPLEAVDFRKQRIISRTALFYCMLHRLPENMPKRFDVVAVLGNEQIRHIENAFWFQI